MSSSLVKVRTPARDKGRPHRGSSSDSVEERHDHAAAAASGRATRGTNRQERCGQGGAAAAAARGDGADGGVGGVFALGDMLKHKMNEVLSGAGPPSGMSTDSSGPQSLEHLLRDRIRLEGPGSTLPDARSDNESGSDIDSIDSQLSRASNASSVTLQDGTDAMVIAHCIRRGHASLECPVCLHILSDPVSPTGATCKCVFCRSCFAGLVISGTNVCSKCGGTLPGDTEACRRDREVAKAIASFHQQGGEDAEYSGMMETLRKGDAKYRVVSLDELSLVAKPIAVGAYGQVFKGVWRPKGGEGIGQEGSGGIAVAVKKIVKPQMASMSETIESFKKEVEILSLFDHPHVLKLYGAVVEADDICIVTELVPGGSLFELIYTRPQLQPEAVVVIGQGVCKGMTYLHTLGVIHRDLKPGNLLMGAVNGQNGPELVVKIADFGLARVQDPSRAMTGGIGTSQYTAPEVLRSEFYGTKVDVFSFGIILWEMHAQKIPYEDMNQMQIAVAVATQNHRLPPPPNCPGPIWDLMQVCWEAKPGLRPSFDEILTHFEDMMHVFNLQGVGSAAPLAPAGGGGGGGGGFQNTVAGGGGRGEGGDGGAKVKRDGGRVIRVPQDYPTIADALVASGRQNSGITTISLSPGHYRESLVVRDQTVEIAGSSSMQHQLIEGVQGQGGSVLSIYGGFVRIRAVMIKSGGGGGVGPVVCVGEQGGMVMEDCNVSGGGGSAVCVEEKSEAAVRRSVLCRCGGHGIITQTKGLATVESCSIFENGGSGMYATGDGSKIRVTKCMISHNAGVGGCVDQGGGMLVEDNDLRSNAKGTHSGEGGDLRLGDNLMA